MTREAFPDQPNLSDVVHSIVSAGAKALVLAGLPLDHAESLVESTSIFFPTPLRKRQKEFIDGLAEKARKNEATLAASPIMDPERFVAFAAGVFRQVSETAEREKLVYFQNALLNASQHKVVQLDYLRSLLDVLTVDHVGILSFFSEAHPGRKLRPFYLAEDAAELLTRDCSQFREQRDYAEVLFRDVWGRCLLAFPHRVPGVLPPGMEKLFALEEGSRLSPLGEGFLRLIRDPAN